MESKEMKLRDGRSSRRERTWGRVGAIVGTCVGVGAALVAVYLDGMPWTQGPNPYPSIFAKMALLSLDVFLLGIVIAGVGFSILALFFTRRSPYPRSDAFGAALMGLILSSTGGLMFFLRICAMIRGGA